ncbi:MAG: hypothetical protein QOC94_4041 [Actinoplanes sp.]|jgi:cytochrome P450|nr:hypothetical protein [Actinoplanes sp.]
MPAETPADSKRKVERGELAPGCPAHAGPDNVWKVQDFGTARAMLRHTETRQAGFGIERFDRVGGKMRMPVLFRDGVEHREHRRQTAKYFTPKKVDSSYRELMGRLADEQCDLLCRRGEADLSQLSFRLAVGVAAEVIGLTESGPGMAKRLNRFFAEHSGTPGWRNPKAAYQQWRSNLNVALFYWRDVRPAVTARKAESRDDLISHLLSEGCNKAEILSECITFAAAGMITTREFITVAAWHLFSDDALRLAYLEGTEKERVAILHEILRLEPVVGRLFRRTTAEIQVGDVTIPAGARLDISVAATNLDPAAAGPNPGAVCPARPVADGFGDAGLSFGDGPHRCPGAYIAIQETDTFLTKLFALPGLTLVQEPTTRIRPEISSYELVGMRLKVS